MSYQKPFLLLLGYELQLSLEAVMGFSQVATPVAEARVAGPGPRPARSISGHVRRFLKSLRIAADETIEEV